ncbi:CHASE2 domain-containing protein [Neptunomonas marina]|uniref:CHASE2 domain-containing protein n=1 Tax=Neptunomonas marina TaxID=1815562 RepID=A0A437Q9I4_9GAMM|nr:CHASE2 domain-containing protein [Neptunomonas marina]RVU31013.1 CHASE2 domain-containing protein [Neptunomonas marina]
MKSKGNSLLWFKSKQLNNKVFRFLAKVSLISVLSFSVLNLSPFGLSDVIDRYSQDLFTTWVAEFNYPKITSSDTSQFARDHYSVVLITENSLKWFAEGWPLSPDSYARVLMNLWAMKPRAIFIDIHWISMMKKGEIAYDPSSSLCSDQDTPQNTTATTKLSLVLAKLKESGIQLFTSVDNRDQWCRLPSNIRDYLTPVSVGVDLDPGDFIARSYPLFEKSKKINDSSRLKSAALALCEVWKKHSVQQEQCLKPSIKQIDLVWGVQDNPDNYWMSPEKPLGSLDFIAQGLLDVRYKRPYATTVFIEDILNPLPEVQDEKIRIGSSKESKQHNYAEIERLTQKIKDRIIFLGAKIDGVDDFVFTSNRQVRPGVYYHAMAFDNLVSFGDSVKSRTRSDQGDLLQYAIIFLLSATAAGAAMLPRERLGKAVLVRSRGSLPKRFIGLFVYVVLKYIYLPFSLIFVFVAIYINSEVLNLPPSFWVGYFGLIMLGVFFGSMDVFPIFNKYKNYLLKGVV